MAWLYEICDSKDRVVKSDGGFATQEEAMAVGSNEKDRLVASRSLPGRGLRIVGIVRTIQDSSAPTKPQVPLCRCLEDCGHHPKGKRCNRLVEQPLDIRDMSEGVPGEWLKTGICEACQQKTHGEKKS